MRFAPDVILVRAALPLHMEQLTPSQSQADLFALSVTCLSVMYGIPWRVPPPFPYAVV